MSPSSTKFSTGLLVHPACRVDMSGQNLGGVPPSTEFDGRPLCVFSVVFLLLVNQHPDQTDGPSFLVGGTVAAGNNLHNPVFSNKLINPAIQLILLLTCPKRLPRLSEGFYSDRVILLLRVAFLPTVETFSEDKTDAGPTNQQNIQGGINRRKTLCYLCRFDRQVEIQPQVNLRNSDPTLWLSNFMRYQGGNSHNWWWGGRFLCGY